MVDDVPRALARTSTSGGAQVLMLELALGRFATVRASSGVVHYDAGNENEAQELERRSHGQLELRGRSAGRQSRSLRHFRQSYAVPAGAAAGGRVTG